MRSRLRVASVVIIVGAIVLLLSGCASIVKGRTENIGVSSSPIGATFTVDGMTHTTPAIVKLSRKHDHVIVFEKPGYEPASGTITSSMNMWWLGNLIWYVGAPIGMAIDFADGATYSLNPTDVEVNLIPKSPNQNSDTE